MPRPNEVFVSHSHRNNKFINELADVLDRHAISYFLSGRTLKAGQNWNEEIGNALDRCDWFLLILSPQALRSQWVAREYSAALRDKTFNGRVIPCWWRKCEPKGAFWTVGEIHSKVTFVKNKEAGFRHLIEDVFELRYIA